MTKSLIGTATKHANIDEVYRISISTVAKIVVGSFAFHTSAIIATGSNLFNVTSLPSEFDATYDFIMQAGGAIYMGNTVAGYKYLRANSSIPSGATVFGVFVAGLS